MGGGGGGQGYGGIIVGGGGGVRSWIWGDRWGGGGVETSVGINYFSPTL